MKKNVAGFISLVLIFALVVVGGCASESQAAEASPTEFACTQEVTP